MGRIVGSDGPGTVVILLEKSVNETQGLIWSRDCFLEIFKSKNNSEYSVSFISDRGSQICLLINHLVVEWIDLWVSI